MELATRYKIIGVEVVGFGAFVLFLLLLELNEAVTNQIAQNFSWVWGIVEITMILVGLELLSLNAKTFAKTRAREGKITAWQVLATRLRRFTPKL